MKTNFSKITQVLRLQVWKCNTDLNNYIKKRNQNKDKSYSKRPKL